MGCEFGGLLLSLLDAARAENWARPEGELVDRDAELHEAWQGSTLTPPQIMFFLGGVLQTSCEVILVGHLEEKLDWNRLAGRRMARTRAMLLSKEDRFHRVLLSLSIEPLRHVHSCFLKHAHTAPDDASWPLLLNELWPPASRNVAAMEHLATLLGGESSRLVLLFALSQNETVAQWVENCPEEAKRARSTFLLVAASLHRRYVTRLRIGIVCFDLSSNLAWPNRVHDVRMPDTETFTPDLRLHMVKDPETKR